MATDTPRDALVPPPCPPDFLHDNLAYTAWREGWLAGRESIPYAEEWWKAPGNITAPDGTIFLRRDAQGRSHKVGDFDTELLDLCRNDDYEGIYRVMHKRRQPADPDPFGRDHADTLRDLDARAAMAAMYANPNNRDVTSGKIAKEAFRCAASMAYERGQE